MNKKVITIIILTICIVVIWCLWKNAGDGLSVKKPVNMHERKTPVVNLEFSHVEDMVVDTTMVYSSSDIAYSAYFSPFIFLESELWEYHIKVYQDSLEYFHLFETETINGHTSPRHFNYYVEKSAFKIRNNIIHVQGYRIQILNDETLKVLNLPKIPSGTILCCSRRMYNDKNLKFYKKWKNGKKHGNWVYVDENGDAAVSTYESDSLLKTEAPTKEYLDFIRRARWW